jgi:hypothetical protein
MIFQRIITQALAARIQDDFAALLAAVDGEVPSAATDAVSAGCVKVYMDDILIHARTVAGHLLRLLWALRCLHAAGLRINLKKCDFLQREVSFLGHIIDGVNKRIDPARLQGLRDLRSPRSARELRAVVGLFNYYSPFIPHLADKMAPLRELTRRPCRWCAHGRLRMRRRSRR